MGEILENKSFEDFKTELKQKNDLVAVASKYVQLERKGHPRLERLPLAALVGPIRGISQSHHRARDRSGHRLHALRLGDDLRGGDRHRDEPSRRHVRAGMDHPSRSLSRGIQTGLPQALRPGRPHHPRRIIPKDPPQRAGDLFVYSL